MVFKTKNKTIDLEIKVILEICSYIDSCWFKKLQNCRRSCKHSSLPPNNSSLSLGTEIMEICGLEARVLSRD